MKIRNLLNSTQRDALFGGVLSSLSGWCGYLLFNSSNKGTVMISGIFVALSLFFWRVRFRFVYGLIELLFGLFLLWDASGKGRGAFSSDFGNDFQAFQFSVVLIQTSGAIYVLIRGLDNCFQGLSKEFRDRFEAAILSWPL